MPVIPLEDKQRTTELLLRAGASIREMNTVRKHLSRVKGGLLAETAYPASVLSLILSDVIGSPLDVIGSGPTAPDPTTYRDAADVLDRYHLTGQLPASVRNWIELGVKGQEAETPKSGEACFAKTANIIVGGIDLALSAAGKRAESLGLAAEIVTAELQGEAREAGGQLAHRAREARRRLRRGEVRCFLSGGETTVTVHGEGRGGRNQELALAFALAAEGTPGVMLLSAGTDGIDGPTDAAGAIVDGETAKRARAAGIDPGTYLVRNDSYSFFRELDRAAGTASQLVTGPTGTNVMDLQILCVENKDESG
jgi:glycerate-2-kinase